MKSRKQPTKSKRAPKAGSLGAGLIFCPTTLQQAIASIKNLRKPAKTGEKSIANELLGKYKGIIPTEKTSTEIIKGFRASLYGKVKE